MKARTKGKQPLLVAAKGSIPAFALFSVSFVRLPTSWLILQDHVARRPDGPTEQPS